MYPPRKPNPNPYLILNPDPAPEWGDNEPTTKTFTIPAEPKRGRQVRITPSENTYRKTKESVPKNNNDLDLQTEGSVQYMKTVHS